MASSILFGVAFAFAVRGLQLGLVGVISRSSGVLLGYYLGFSYRAGAAEVVAARTGTDLPPLVLQAICGGVIFFTTLFLVAQCVSSIFKLLALVIPPVKTLIDNKSWPGKIAGSITNAVIGAIIVLLGLWGYDQVSKKPLPTTELQVFANDFGNAIFFPESSSTSFISTKSSDTIESIFSRGTATISSESDPEKTLSIESIREIFQTSPNSQFETIDPAKLMDSEQLQTLLEDPKIRQLVMDQLQENPEQLKDILNNPTLRDIFSETQ